MTSTLRHALSQVRQNYDSVNWWRNRVLVPYVFGTATRLHPGYPDYADAVHVMEEDWDNLFVLDACRADYFEAVADLDRFDDYSRSVSLGSHSSEWTRRNFADGQYGDTVIVSANPHTTKVAGDSFHEIIPMWERDFDDDAGTVLPERMVEAARAAHERHPNKRLIVHFMQPHAPFVGSDITDTDDPERYWQAYTETLEYVLEHALDLAESIDGKTVFTADHGELNTGTLLTALGFDAHRPRLRHPGLVNVPWAVLEGTRREIVDGTVTSTDGDTVDDRLRDLGYKV